MIKVVKSLPTARPLKTHAEWNLGALESLEGHNISAKQMDSFSPFEEFAKFFDNQICTRTWDEGKPKKTRKRGRHLRTKKKKTFAALPIYDMYVVGRA